MTHHSHRLDEETYLSLLERDGERLAIAAERGLDADVPGCPGWTAEELVAHMYEVHHFWGSIASRELQDPKAVVRQPRPPRSQLLTAYRAGLRNLVDALRTSDPKTPVWTWSPEHEIAWIQRRMSQETAVHRWDAESASGAAEPIDPKLAVDGIDEFLEFFVTPSDGAADVRVHLHATDSDGEWLVTLSDGKLEVAHDHAKGDVAVQGRASDLLLLLWGRIPEADVTVHGDRSALFRFLELADLD